MADDPITCTDRTHYFQPSVNGVQPPRCYCGKREVGEMHGVEVLIEGTLTVPADPATDLLRRAADRLDELEAATICDNPRCNSQTPWTHGPESITVTARDHTTTGAELLRVNVAPHDAAVAALIVALRPVASPLSRWLRTVDSRARELDPAGDGYLSANVVGYREARDVARAILGEEVPW